MLTFESYLIRLEEDLKAVKIELAQLPVGCMVKSGQTLLHKVKGKTITISKDTEMQKKLCRKAVLKLIEKILKFNLNLRFSQYQLRKTYNVLTLVATLGVAYRDMPFSYFSHPSLQRFIDFKWKSNPYPFDHVPIKSNGGRLVRSLGEVTFVNLLEAYPVYFQVDVALQLGERTIYPDFIVFEPAMGRTFVGEYFGLCGTAGYDEAMEKKMADYRMNGYVLGVNLFYLFPDDIKNPDKMKEIIEGFILGGNY